MPKKAKAAEPEAKPEAARGAKTAAIRQTLKDNPKKTAKEIAELLKEQGFETTPNYIAAIRLKMGERRRKKRPAAPAPTEAAVPVVPKDAVSLGLLTKAKKLASQFSSIKEAKAAIDALAQIMD